MTKLLIASLINICINPSYTKIQKEECLAHFGSCVVNYSTEKKALKECSKKWNKIKEEIK